MALLRAQGLVKTHGTGRGARRILDGATLEVGRGELVAVTGRSGSGKSTLLNVLGGLDWLDDGAIELDGHRLDARAERAAARLRRRYVGFVFQAFHLVPELSGRDNVLLPTRIGATDGTGVRRADALIERLGLAEVAGHRPHELSGGEQQRFALARALVNDPPLLLADEPTGNLDAESGVEVLELLASLAGEHAVVLVTHDEAAVRAADRRLRLDDGRLRAW
jgi:ABC-type lipoprotein export system ATPase subunit